MTLSFKVRISRTKRLFVMVWLRGRRTYKTFAGVGCSHGFGYWHGVVHVLGIGILLSIGKEGY